MKAEVNAAKKAVLAAVEDAVAEAAGSIRDDARKLVPQDTGTLHANIVANVTSMSAEIGVFDKDVFYGQFVEFGTSKQRAQPFMTPAAEMERKRFVNRIKQHVEKKL